MDLNAENSYGEANPEISHTTFLPSPARHSHRTPGVSAIGVRIKGCSEVIVGPDGNVQVNAEDECNAPIGLYKRQAPLLSALKMRSHKKYVFSESKRRH
jgi:hypothetical protein